MRSGERRLQKQLSLEREIDKEKDPEASGTIMKNYGRKSRRKNALSGTLSSGPA